MLCDIISFYAGLIQREYHCIQRQKRDYCPVSIRAVKKAPAGAFKRRSEKFSRYIRGRAYTGAALPGSRYGHQPADSFPSAPPGYDLLPGQNHSGGMNETGLLIGLAAAASLHTTRPEIPRRWSRRRSHDKCFAPEPILRGHRFCRRWKPISPVHSATLRYGRPSSCSTFSA